MAFLEKLLFTTYTFNPTSARANSQDSDTDLPAFSISLPSLLETLQMFGVTDAKSLNPFNRDPYTSAPFSNQVIGFTNGVCRLMYDSPGSPLTIILEEQGITTTCDLTTYEPSFTNDIPFARDQLALKIIMRSSYLHDAIVELGSQNPKSISLRADKEQFTLSATSDIGRAQVSFARAPAATAAEHTHANLASNSNGDSNAPRNTAGLLETYNVPRKFYNSYKFSHIAAARRAMAAATKVSIRADEQGVVSLQFMIENVDESGSSAGGNAGVSFVDFRFVPLVGEEGESGDEDEEGGNTDSE